MKICKTKNIAALSVCAFSALLTGCDLFEGTGEKVSLSVESGTAYADGDQVISVSLDTAGYSFESDISASDISLDGDLVGKSVSSVSYVSSSSIDITISGSITNSFEKTGLGYINIDGGISGNAYGVAAVNVYKTQMHNNLYSVSTSPKGDGTYQFSASFYLPYGNFVEEYATTDYVALTSDNGEITKLYITDTGNLYVHVESFTRETTSSYPQVHIAPEVTTFNKDIYAYVGYMTFPGDGNGYDLV